MAASSHVRLHGRALNQVRPVAVHYNSFGYAPASVLYEIGNTKVLCAVSMQPNVPPFLKGSKTGWLKAEYAMLPTATQARTQRESSQGERNGRSVEISRFIGRALRSMINFELLGERTIIIDCDVLQADGGTRTACITASCLALHAAVDFWIKTHVLQQTILKGKIAAISAGIINNLPMLDLDCAEDNGCEADFNIVLTEQGDIIEVQGTAEKKAVSAQNFDAIMMLARQGIQQLFSCTSGAQSEEQTRAPASTKTPLFSLQNRLQSPG